ncbi:AAA family ATPase [Leptospira interrogans]|uniref:AAA family ATPase n=1 Tax=Leptospira interrogans TaxID=173 RepID=UPI0002973258|nr:AAA family ATPase [Leptospira interrogans]EKR84720.1 AAA domain protein [Leptospira interrogans str. UI 08452]EMN35874.1 AAA domain protein [Leptospira interrogans serovar Medanensis str. L0448]EMN38865.1 AAA domain protein [Leptospira interrogans str. L0996]UML84002.1 AAA family ATPase [Leptospira interrogans]
MSMDIAKLLKDADQKVQLLYAFNGTGKTRLSREFKQLVAPKNNRDEADQAESSHNKILYYNASTEDLFFWDNDLEKDAEPKLKIQSNSFTDWILKDQGQDRNIITNFQHYTNEKLTPRFNEAYTVKDKNEQEVIVKEFSEVTFSLTRGNEEHSGNLKISKGEESNFIWSIFYSLLEQVISVLNVIDSSEQETDQFDQLEYVFIDDPVSSLDENHLIELAAELIQSSKSDIRFLITTHNPLFYNVLHNEFKKDTFKKYILKKQEDESYELANQSTDSPFSYHLHLKAELEKAIETGQLHKYHFNFLRNILEKTSTFVGLERWGDLLPKTEDGDPNPYEVRIINFSSHSKHSDNEVVEVPDEHRRVLSFLVKKLDEMYRLRMRTK